MKNELTYGDAGIDRSIGWLTLGLVIGAFIILTMAGMGQIQDNAEEIKNRAAEPQEQVQRFDFAE